MKKSTKLIAMLTVIALLATMAATALADDKLYTSTVFSIPKERVEEDLSQIEMPEPQKELPGTRGHPSGGRSRGIPCLSRESPRHL